MLTTYPIFQPFSEVFAFSTQRDGGVSEGAYASFNITHYCGDRPECVRQNRERLARRLGFEESRIFLPHQVHDTRSLAIDADFLALPREEQTARMEGIDALLTQERGICIGVSTADCVPLLFYDAATHSIAAVHAGWRGTVACIAAKAVSEMARQFGCQPADMRVAVGPCISQAAFEVGEEVYEAFFDAGFPMDRIARREQKWHIDLPAANALLLRECGVKPERIHLSGLCTYSSPDRFFSARRLGIQSGRVFNGIMLRT